MPGLRFFAVAYITNSSSAAAQIDEPYQLESHTHATLMMLKCEDEDGVGRTFARIFQDAYFRKSHNNIVPFVQNDTAQSGLYRIINLMDSEIGTDTSPQYISKEVILTLLQCAARLYEGEVYVKEEAADLIKCKEFRTILLVTIQEKDVQAKYEEYEASIRLEGPTNENSVNASLLSAKHNNTVRQLDNKVIIVENIASLCHTHLDTLQNICESAKVHESFMFGNFTILVDSLSFIEKSWLVILFPYLFQWREQTCGDFKASGYRIVARCSIPSADSVISGSLAEAEPAACSDDSPSNHGSILPLCLSPNLNWSFLDDEDDAAQIFRLSPEPCHNLSLEKLVSPSLVAQEFHSGSAVAQGTKVASGFVNSSKAGFGYEETEQRSSIYSSLDSQTDRELLRLFANMKLQVGDDYTVHQKLSQLFEDPALTQGWLKRLQKSRIEQHNPTTILTFISVFKNAIVAGNREGGYKEENVLSTIPEESEEAPEPEERIKKEGNSRHQAELKIVDLSFLVLPCALEKERLSGVRSRLDMIQVLGWDEFWKRAKEGSSILADTFATLLWMAKAIKTFREYSNPTLSQLTSIQLDPLSAELALRFLRGDRSTETILRIRGQMKSVLEGERITEAEFISVINAFAAGFDNAKSEETLCQMVHWIGQRGEYRTFLAGFVPAGISGKEKRAR